MSIARFRASDGVRITTQQTESVIAAIGASWVDDVLLAGPDDQLTFSAPVPITRAELRRLVAERRDALVETGLRPGGAAALRLAPSIAYVANLLATWQLGAQAILLHHRLTDFEVNRAAERLHPQVYETVDQTIRLRLRTGGLTQDTHAGILQGIYRRVLDAAERS